MAPDPIADRYRVAVEVAPCGALLADRSGVIVLANDRLAEMFETTVEELIGLCVDALLPAAQREGHRALRQTFIDNPETRPMGNGRDLRARTLAGRELPVEVSLRPVDGMTLCMVVDVTEQRLQAERFRTALDAAPNAILMVDPDGRIVLCNRHTERVFGHPRDTLIGRAVEVLLPNDRRQQHEAHRTEYASAPTPRAMGVGRELRGLRADGSEFPVEVALQPVTTPDGRFIIASVVDITLRVENQRTIESQYAQLEERNRELRALVRSTSHELKGPLRTIAGLASSILEDLAEENLDDVSRMSRWVEDLAGQTAETLAKLHEVGDASLQPAPRTSFALVPLVQTILRDLASLQHASDVEVRVSIPAGFEVHAEQSRVASILHQLLRNALTYVRRESADRWVEVEAELVGDTARIRIRDNGTGIPEDMRARVFELFERGTHPGAGPGIGLTLARRHAAQLRGTVHLDAGTPTTFTLELPGGTP